ncbi:MAG: glycosyltransferase [Anaerolineales bacterium]|nr:glycosyltransferase [Anaerolineales bacterium]
MHIAYFTNFYHPVVNGVVRSVSAFRESLTALGHNVFIFAQHASDYEDTEPFIFRYPAINLPIQAKIPAAIPISPFVDRLLPSLKLDVIHTHHPFLLGQTAATKAEELGLPLIFTFHTRYRQYVHYFPLPQETVQEFLRDAVDIWMGEFMQKCHHIVVPSESVKTQMKEEYGIEEGVTVIPTGVDLRPYEQADGRAIRAARGWANDQVLISVGRLAPEKNWKTLLEAFARLLPTHPALRLALLGHGPSLDDLKNLAQDLGIAPRVEFVGTVPFEDIPRYLKAADMFVFASTSETQGLVTMEALAAGLPVVAVEASGTRDVVRNGQDGVLTENDPDALAQAIQRVLDNKTLYQFFKNASLRRAKDFDLTTQAQNLLTVYAQAIEDKKANRAVVVPKAKKFLKALETGPLKQMRELITEIARD